MSPKHKTFKAGFSLPTLCYFQRAGPSKRFDLSHIIQQGPFCFPLSFNFHFTAFNLSNQTHVWRNSKLMSKSSFGPFVNGYRERYMQWFKVRRQIGWHRVRGGSFVSIAGKPPISRPLTFGHAVPKTAEAISGVLPTAPGREKAETVNASHRNSASPALRPHPGRGAALAQCIVGAVAWAESVVTTSPVTPPFLILLVLSTPALPQLGLLGPKLSVSASQLSLPCARETEAGVPRGGASCASERPPYVLVPLATAAREPGVPAAASSGGVGGTRWGRREPAAAAATATAKWRRRWRTPGG